MNYQYLLRQIYEQPKPQLAESVIIKNPYEKDDEAVGEIHSDKNYDLSVLNTSVPAAEIIEMMQNAIKNDKEITGRSQGIRLLFYGLNGTGKTNLAHYIAESLDKEIISKKASDIFGMYVGESEKHIAQAFDEARTHKKILLFDEADSFFRERTTALHSWEITLVNEFLTQMENFDGIVICTTNLREIMDKAMQRRFHFMVEFKALKDDGVEKLLAKYFSKFDFNEDKVKKLCRFKTVTPGDFRTVYERLRFMQPQKITSDYIIEELCDIQKEKDYGNKTVGFLN